MGPTRFSLWRDRFCEDLLRILLNCPKMCFILMQIVNTPGKMRTRLYGWHNHCFSCASSRVFFFEKESQPRRVLQQNMVEYIRTLHSTAKYKRTDGQNRRLERKRASFVCQWIYPHEWMSSLKVQTIVQNLPHSKFWWTLFLPLYVHINQRQTGWENAK